MVQSNFFVKVLLMAFRRFYVFRPLNFLLSGLLWKERYCRAFSWTVQLAFAIQDLNSNKHVYRLIKV